MTAPSLLWVAIAVGWLLVDGTAGANISSSSSLSPGRDKEIYKKNMQSFLANQRPPSTNTSTGPTPLSDRELALLARVVHDIRHLNASILRDNATLVSAAHEREMRAIYRQVQHLARLTSGGRTRQARILLKALSMLAGAKLGKYMHGKKSSSSGSVSASDSLDWLGKIFNLAVTVSYGKPNGAANYNGAGNSYYGPACNDNTWPDCSTGASPCNANGLPACYFNWPLCNSNVFPVCSTTSGTPCNNNGLPYCVDIGVPCNANTLGYCLNGAPPCNDNNWPFCPGYGLAVTPFAAAVANPNVNTAGVVNLNGNAGTGTTLLLGNRVGNTNTRPTSLNGNAGNVNTRPASQVGNKVLGNTNTRPTSLNGNAGNFNTRPTSSNGNVGNFNTRPNSLIGNKVGNVNTRPTSSNGNLGNINTRPTSSNGNLGNINTRPTSSNGNLGNINTRPTSSNGNLGNINTRPTSSNGNAGNFNTRPASLVGNKVGNSNTRPTPFNGNNQGNVNVRPTSFTGNNQGVTYTRPNGNGGNTNSQPWATIANNMADTNMAGNNAGNTNVQPWAVNGNNNGNVGNTNMQPWDNIGNNNGNVGNTNTEPWANTANNNNENMGNPNTQHWTNNVNIGNNNGNTGNMNTQPWANNGNAGNTDMTPWATAASNIASVNTRPSPLAGALGNKLGTRPSAGNTNTRPAPGDLSLMPRPPQPAFFEQESPRPGVEALPTTTDAATEETLEEVQLVAATADPVGHSKPPAGKPHPMRPQTLPQRIQGFFSRPNKRKPSDAIYVQATTSRPETIALRPSTDKKKKKQPAAKPTTTTTTTTTESPIEPLVQEEEYGVEEEVLGEEEVPNEEEAQAEEEAQIEKEEEVPDEDSAQAEEEIPAEEEFQAEEEVPAKELAEAEGEVEEVVEEEAGDTAIYDTTLTTGPYINIDIVTTTEVPEPEGENYPDADYEVILSNPELDGDKNTPPEDDSINVQSHWLPALNSEHPSAPIIDGALDADDADDLLLRTIDQPRRQVAQHASTKVKHAKRRAAHGDNPIKPVSNGTKRPSNRIKQTSTKQSSNSVKRTSTKQSSNNVKQTSNKINQSSLGTSQNSNRIKSSNNNARKKIKYVRKKVKVNVHKKVGVDNAMPFVDEKENNFAKPANNRSRLLYGLPKKFHTLAKISNMSVAERNATTGRRAHRPGTKG